MTKKAVFEVTTFADAIRKAARVAPTKGAEFDKAAGIVIEVDPTAFHEKVVIKSTRLDVSIRIHCNVLELGDEAATWRVPSKLLSGLVSTLPVSSGTEIKLLDKGDGELYFQCGKTKARIRQIRGDYPAIPKHDHDKMKVVEGLAARLSQVSWAVDRGALNVLGGVHMDGEWLVAGTTSRIAVVPCKIDLDAPITAPLHEIASIIKNTSEVKMLTTDNHIVLAPDAYTQGTSTLIEGAYAKFKPLLEDKSTHSCVISAEKLASTLDRVLTLAESERNPATNFEFGDGVLTIEMDVPEVGKTVDEIEMDGGGSTPMKMRFDANVVKSIVNASGRGLITIKYYDPMRPVVFSDDNDFRCVMIPMAVIS